MAQWDALHPFNMFVSVCVQGPLDEPALRATIAREDGAASLAVLSGAGEDRDADYDARAADELNTRLDPAAPRRVVALAWPDAHLIGLTQRHQRGDGVSAFAALVRVVCQYLGVRVPASVPVGSAPVPLSKAWRGVVPWHRWPGLLAESFAELSTFARCHRPAFGLPSALADRVITVALPQDTRARARAAGRPLGGTVNDVLVAALAQAIADATRDDRGPTRRGIALSLPVDMRALNPEALQSAAGVYVSFMNVVLSGEERPFPSLLGEIVASTTAAKRRRSYAKTGVEMWAAARLARGLTREERPRYLSRQRPYCGVLTSPRVPAEWLAPELRQTCSRWRAAVSSGPMTPLVMAVTTAPDDRVECVVSARDYGYSPAQIGVIASAFRNRLAALQLTRAASSSCPGSA